MKRNIRKRAFLLISQGGLWDDISSSVKEILKDPRKFDISHPVESIKKILNKPEIKEKQKTKEQEVVGFNPAIRSGAIKAGPPSGYSSISTSFLESNPQITQIAKDINKSHSSTSNYGYLERHNVGGKDLIFQVEEHFDNHPAGGKGPPFPHPGVSVYEKKSTSPSDKEDLFTKEIEKRIKEIESGRYTESTGSPSPAALKALFDANQIWKDRRKGSDGIMGDPSHQTRKSDHNTGNAVDITHDPISGADGDKIAQLATKDSRVKYVIWNGQIWKPGKGWSTYTGTDPHKDHVHISILSEERGNSSPWPWSEQ